LTAIAFNLAALKKGVCAMVPEERERLEETSELVAQTLEQMRELSLELRPSMLDELGLVPTLRWYARRCAERLNIEIDLVVHNVEETVCGEAATALYRIVQEALTNVAKHSGAGRVDIRLEFEPPRITAVIEDDGVGFDPAELAGREGSARGMGLLGIRERVAALGGRFEIESSPGRGTRLTVDIPLLAGGAS
jgi:signal transduction histidine kinase